MRTWLHESARRAIDEEGQLHEHIFGKAPDMYVSIFEDAVEDGDLSEKSGRPRFRNVPMISVKNRGERDYVSVPLTNEHLQRFPNAARWWNAHKNDAAQVSVRLLPGITPAEVAELEALSLSTLDALIDASVPSELEQWKVMAIRLRAAVKPRLRLVDGQFEAVA